MMSVWRSVVSRKAPDPVLMRSQLAALKRQVPLLFLLLGCNVLALAFTHYGVAPESLTLYAPAVLFPICVQRAVAWVQYDIGTLSDEAVKRRLRNSVALVAILGVTFTAWSLMLAPYGDADVRFHVAFFMSITVIGCVFCLMHLRGAAVALTAIVTVPFMLVFLQSGSLVLIAIALNFGMVAVIMTVLMFIHFDEFSALVRSRGALTALSEENSRLAHVDSLTGLANRRSFFRDLATLTESASVTDRGFALGMIDLDGFKAVNDLYGHGAGDLVLAEAGRRLSLALGSTAKLARLGGDEFAFVLFDRIAAADLEATGQTVCRALEAPFALPAGIAQIGASLGFAVFPTMARTREQLIERADYALYSAKAQNRGQPVVFTSEHEDAIRDRTILEQELRRADLDKELALHFQPIIDVEENRVVAFEALARWQSPRLGSVTPMSFIVAAERIGLICTMTTVLFGKAIEAMRDWPDDIALSFNLSARDVTSPIAIRRITSMVELSGLAPERFAFEITETALMLDFDSAREALSSLKATGAKISLDDFGTGYSSLGYMRRLPIDKIKVDRSFMADLLTHKASRDIVKTVVDLCQNLNLSCIIEGVETHEHVLILRSLGCHMMQGYYFGKPVPAHALFGPRAALVPVAAEESLVA